MYLCRYIYTLIVQNVKCKHERMTLISFAISGFALRMFDCVCWTLLRSTQIEDDSGAHNIANIQPRSVKLETMAS
jgi:hypothetical protein